MPKSGKLWIIMSLLGVVIAAVAFPPSVYAQCNPPGPNIKCWDGGGDGLRWSHDLNWNPDGVPQAQHNVYHLTGGMILYDVTDAINQTIASFTCNGGAGAGLTINDGLPLHITGNMVRNASPDEPYVLTVNSRADLIVDGNITDIDATLQTGTGFDDTTLAAVNVTGGDWFVPRNTRVEVSGNVDATGNRSWSVGRQIGGLPGGVLIVTGDAIGGTWELYGNDPDAVPLPEIIVNGTIRGGCWTITGTGCPIEPPNCRWTFAHVLDGPDTCMAGGREANWRSFGAAAQINPLPGAIVEGGLWSTDDSRPSGKIDQVIGGVWNQIHKTAKIIVEQQTYVFNVGTMSLYEVTGDCSGTGNDCSMYLNTANLILSGPGDSTIPSLKFTPDGLVCSTLVQNSIETADATSHTGKLTVAGNFEVGTQFTAE